MASVSVESIVELRASMERNDGGRNSSYRDVIQYYTGTDIKTAIKQGYLSGIVSAGSQIFTKQDEDEDLELQTPINIVKPAIDNKVAYLSLTPSVRVIEPPISKAPAAATAGPSGLAGGMAAPVGGAPGAPLTPPTEAPPTPPLPGQPPAQPPMPGQPPEMPSEANPAQETPGMMDPEEWAADFADKEERAIAALLDESNVTRRARDLAWCISAMGGAVLGVWPDLRTKRPRLFTRTPYQFYPVAYDDDGLDLQMALWVDYMTGLEAFAQYGIADYKDEDEVELIFYMDEEKFCTVINGEKWAHPPMDNVMNIVPIVCIGTLGIPGMVFGTTPLKDAVPVAKSINGHMALLDKIANATAEPTIFITDPLEVPDDLAIGKGGVATAGKDGSVQLLGPLQLPASFWTLGEVLNNWFDLIADNPAQLRSDSGSLRTGKGFNASLGPVAARLQTQLDLIMMAWKRVIKYMMLMWANFPGGEAKGIKATGLKRKEYYYIEAQAGDFAIDGETWVELECSANASSYIDKNSDRIGMMQLYQSELLDWDTVADNLDEITDRSRVRRNIDKDRQWKAEGMALAQQLAQSPATANAQVGNQEKINYGMERGLITETPPGPTPSAQTPPAEQAPPAEGMSQAPAHQPLIDVIGRFFSGIGKLKGEAWWGGDPIKNPSAMATDNWKVTVWITDPQDQGTITRAAAKVSAIYNHITFINGRPSPEEQATKFSEGTGEQPPVEAPGAAAPTGMNPALDQMLGGGV